jgi:type II secretory pathway pseudopilin PulG
MMTKFFRQQEGDTLVEVVIATVIIGVILFSAYNLSTKAFQLGQSAKERSQATQVLQEQAEALRSLRDSETWAAFQSSITAGNIPQSDGYRIFHVEKVASGGITKWEIKPNSSVDGFNPQTNNPNISNFYRVKILGRFTPSEISSEKFEAKIHIQWERFGGGPIEQSDLYLKLADRSNIQLGG